MIFLINIYSLKITDINNISLPNVISQILSVNLMLSNIYHLVNSELSLSKMDSFREELKLKKSLKLLYYNNFKDFFEFCHSLLGIIMMCKYRFERFPDYTHGPPRNAILGLIFILF